MNDTTDLAIVDLLSTLLAHAQELTLLFNKEGGSTAADFVGLKATFESEYARVMGELLGKDTHPVFTPPPQGV